MSRRGGTHLVQSPVGAQRQQIIVLSLQNLTCLRTLKTNEFQIQLFLAELRQAGSCVIHAAYPFYLITAGVERWKLAGQPARATVG